MIDADEWCDEPGCQAARFDDRRCIGHIDDSGLADAVLRRKGAIDARGSTLTPARLRRLIDLLTCTTDEAPLLSDSSPGPCFNAARFDDVTFSGEVSFRRAEFANMASFDGATFSGDVDFDGATFAGHADFDRVSFKGATSFYQTKFRDHCGFEDAQFAGRAGFESAIFESSVDLRNARFGQTIRFTAATFVFPCELGPFVAQQLPVFDRCIFNERVQIVAMAGGLTASAASFANGARLRVCRADVALDDIDFGRPSTLSHDTPCERCGLGAMASGGVAAGVSRGPRLITLHGAQVADLSLSGIDLSACRFFGAHGLGSMKIDPSCRWPRSPKRWSNVTRELIADECEKRGGSWLEQRTHLPDVSSLSGADVPTLSWLQLASVYRELREAREGAKDQAGASDLYYGEMEMRRKPRAYAGDRRSMGLTSERVVLTLYWLLSGYGLRAVRALLALVLVVAATAIALRYWGFTPQVSATRAALYSTESLSALFRTVQTPGHHLTYVGEAIQDVLRVVGPVLIGLALLAVRARVKR